ncbi:hypothetical protein CRH09_26510 [Nocardia terpenica]|uniref:Uncharacterized protein n=1 Tax=Nocardia terpenica TaxID=455432 RepID=A0A291RPR7_9NOCA|nr:hypothetical protein CRH09_26510 [Nocardia terpenica]
MKEWFGVVPVFEFSATASCRSRGLSVSLRCIWVVKPALGMLGSIGRRDALGSISAVARVMVLSWCGGAVSDFQPASLWAVLRICGLSIPMR